MNNQGFEIGKFMIDDDASEVFEAYTNGAMWNGWSYIIMTREQVSKWLDSTPYDYKFMEAHTPLNPRDYPVLVIYFEDEETIESSPIPTIYGQILEGYSLNGYTFIPASDENEKTPVDIIASGYEWICPNCEILNHEIEVTEFVDCGACHHTYPTNPPEHALQ